MRAAGEDNFVHAPTALCHAEQCPELENVASAATSRARGSIASRAGEQAVLAQEFPERPAVFLHRERSASDVSLVRMQNRLEKIVLESPNDTRFHCSERLLFRSRSVVGQVKIRKLDRVAIGEHDGAHEHVLEFAHITRPRMTEQAVERGEGNIFRPRIRDRSLLFAESRG